jgi:hypothetical protein
MVLTEAISNMTILADYDQLSLANCDHSYYCFYRRVPCTAPRRESPRWRHMSPGKNAGLALPSLQHHAAPRSKEGCS